MWKKTLYIKTIYKTKPTAPSLGTPDNQEAWRLSFISNIPMSHSTMMTDYKIFYLDYVQDENS